MTRLKWRMGKVIGRTTAVALAVMFCLNSGRAGSSGHTCTECRQSYGYVCLQNLGQCHSALAVASELPTGMLAHADAPRATMDAPKGPR
jgi:hypothetical protein